MALAADGGIDGARLVARPGGAARGWILSCLAVIPILLFAVISIWSSTKILYHWAAPGYLLLLPMLGDWAAGFAPRLRDAVAVPSATLLAAAAMFISAEITYGFIPHLDVFFAPGKSPLLQAVDWDSVATEIPANTSAIAALRWYDAGKIGYALRAQNIPVTVFGPEPHEFGISEPPASLIGKNILILAMPGNVADIDQTYAPYFKTLAPGPTLTVMHHGDLLLAIPTFFGTDLQSAPN